MKFAGYLSLAVMRTGAVDDGDRAGQIGSAVTDATSAQAPVLTSQAHGPADASAGQATTAPRRHRVAAQAMDLLAGLTLQMLVVYGLTRWGLAVLAPAEAEQTLGDRALLVVLGLGVFLALQWPFLRRGQTLGKRLLGLTVVEVASGKPAGPARLFLLRYAPLSVVPLLPAVGPVLACLDAAMLFSRRQRCLHDYLASTRVVRGYRSGPS